jgi:hypothetical protein
MWNFVSLGNTLKTTWQAPNASSYKKIRMKTGIIFTLFLTSLTLLFTACSEEIDMSGERKETAVIYSLLNQADSIHYVKINRAFIGPGNALEIAQIPDSNYFKNVQATIQEVISGNTVRTWVLHDTIIENKESGIFFAPEQKVYYFKTTSAAPLIANANTNYKLDVDINEGAFTVSGNTTLVKEMAINSPNPNASYGFASGDVNVDGYKYASITFAPGNSEIVDVSMIVSFDEFIGATATTKSFTWKLGDFQTDALNDANKSLSASGFTFYSLIKQNATNNDAITRRKLKSIRLNVTGGSDELQKYITINKPSSSLAQNKATYTNLTATNSANVVGIFSARCTVFQHKNAWTQNLSLITKAIDQNSMKELCSGAITGALLFCSDVPTDVNQFYYCN